MKGETTMEGKMKTEKEEIMDRKRDCMLGMTLMILISRFINIDFMDLGEEFLSEIDARLIPILDEKIAETDTDGELLDMEEDMKEFKEELTKFMLAKAEEE